MELKRIAKVAGKGVSSLICTVIGKAFAFGFSHASYACFYWDHPNGSHEDADIFVANACDEFVERVDKWLDDLEDKRKSEFNLRFHELRIAMYGKSASVEEFDKLAEIYERVCETKHYRYSDIHMLRELEAKYKED